MEDDAPPGVPEWVVTYGDMMSLLLTFFIMLVSMSEIVAEQKYRAVLESLHKRLGYAFSPASSPGESFPLNSFVDRVHTMKLGSFIDNPSGVGGVRRESTRGEESRVFTGPEGVGRRTGDIANFDNGGQILDVDTQRMRAVAESLRGKPNKIEVRSWVTPRQMATASNVREAFRRGRAVADLLTTKGVAEERIRIAVVPVPTSSELLGSDIGRNGAVTVAVLDTLSDEFRGRDESSAYPK